MVFSRKWEEHVEHAFATSGVPGWSSIPRSATSPNPRSSLWCIWLVASSVLRWYRWRPLMHVHYHLLRDRWNHSWGWSDGIADSSQIFLHTLQFSVTLSLTRKSNPAMVKWTPECVAAFDDLKKCLCNDPLLCPDFELPFTVQRDTSWWGSKVFYCWEESLSSEVGSGHF